MRKKFEKEILDALEKDNKTIKDIEQLEFDDVENFLTLANIKHDVGWGYSINIKDDMILIVGADGDWWIEVDYTVKTPQLVLKRRVPKFVNYKS